MANMGPGAIAQMAPTYGLATKPSIGSNDSFRNIRGLAPRPRKIPSLSGCVGCVGQDESATTNGNGNGIGWIGALAVPVAIGAVLFVMLK